MEVDYYDVLGVPETASADEIQRAYRMLARRAHPDVDKEPGAEERFKQITEAYHVLSDPQRRAEYDQPAPTFRDFDLTDLFGRMGSVPGADTEAQVTISLEDSYRGGKRTVTLPDVGRYEVTIPRGITDGQRIRLPGRGSQGFGGGPPGDLYLVIRLRPDPRYQLSGRDVTVRLPVTPWEAELGAKVPLTTPGGEIRVDVPPGSSTGRRLRLRGQGLPNPRGNPGDLYAEIRIMVPPHPDATERRLFEELARVSTYNPRSNG
ncbi:DnaJ C-terminal domain-containing protein [Dactylosporangium sp. CA-139066]|uniref:DnaJ C-terminal domain-containing protein n=1 Tax=Dactylosporangium sp. CA-139066 TaxID=3239930 RepID=UPI003D935F28